MKKNIIGIVFLGAIIWGVICVTKKDIYYTPEIIVTPTTGMVMIESDHVATGEYDYFIDESNGWKYSYVSGYQYVYKYKDILLTIGINDARTDEFYTNTKEKLFIREGNKISYYPKNSEGIREADEMNFIQVFKKDPNKPLIDIITQEHLPKDCYVYQRKDEGNNVATRYDHLQELEAYSIRNERSSMQNLCRPDKAFPENDGMIVFIMNPAHPERYYKMSRVDGCAPSCGIFNIVEID